jgi:molecular chaperone GrpE
MSRKKKEKSQTDTAQATELDERPETAAEAPEAAQAERVEEKLTPEQEIEKLRDENLRLVAELRNVTQRAQREKQEALRYAEADFAKELLIVLDDLERTQESARTASRVQAVADGVRIVYEHFLKVLRGKEIEPIEALGKPFDPHWHEAMMQQPSEEHPAGTVMQELARGYQMRDRVIRPAKVVVSSGPPTPADGQGSDDKGESDADV